jgi:hypothetical protein
MTSSSTSTVVNDVSRDVGASSVALSSTALLANATQEDPLKKMVIRERDSLL